MQVIVACEQSGTVRDAFISRGHDAISVDLAASLRPGPHHRGDIFRFLEIYGHQFDLLIAHPPCRYLANSGVHCLYSERNRYARMVDGAEFFRRLLDWPIPRVVVENPIIHKYAKTIVGRRQDQTIQPYQFGEDASKRTCLWLRGVNKLIGTEFIEPSHPGKNGKQVYANQTPSGQNKLGPSADRERLRSQTYSGIANAMADQWRV